MISIRHTFLALLFVISTAAEAETPTAKGERHFGVDLNEAAGVDFDEAVSLVKAAGAESASVSLNWDDLEPTPNGFRDPNNFLYLTNSYYPTKNLKVDLFIRPVDTDGKHVPPDLRDVSFGDKIMISRFLKLLDFVFSKLPNAELNFLAIGNEMTLAHPATDSFWLQYEVFYRAVTAAAKQKRPDLKIGTVGTMYELTGEHSTVMKRLNKHSDIVLVSYYPLNRDFSVKNPRVLFSDFDSLVRVYPRKTIYFSETGYPSSPLLHSSEELQGRFIENTFQAWDSHASQVRYISFAWLHDQSSAQLDQFQKYYGSSHPNFRAYLATLGLRTRNGQDKQSMRTLRAQAKSRGWFQPK